MPALQALQICLGQDALARGLGDGDATDAEHGEDVSGPRFGTTFGTRHGPPRSMGRRIEAVLDPEEAELVCTMLNHAATQLACEPDACSHADSAESQVAPAPRLAVTPLRPQVAGHGRGDSAELHMAPFVAGVTESLHAAILRVETMARLAIDAVDQLCCPSTPAERRAFARMQILVAKAAGEASAALAEGDKLMAELAQHLRGRSDPRDQHASQGLGG